MANNDDIEALKGPATEPFLKQVTHSLEGKACPPNKPHGVCLRKDPFQGINKEQRTLLHSLWTKLRI